MAVMRSAVASTTRIEWNPFEQDAEARADMLQRAEARFNAHRRAGGEVLERQVNGTYKRVTAFNPEADELILVPPVAGG